ncbi:uncharacterized protein BJ212DRAFT_1590991 [Suillus subaureus]|uniref:Uncharacterized protein n=1 Tax=Suillus subaureus TaxID=48587 RepID=A0A9P7DVV6_9AGAM|nr:uncharacterized protein BJ212DRAFT_1590991 [Suillus subaureus]KAG1804397.1 hypothetical protein BJ212DRAFT_1590991 [Suillus subaureus]
MSALQGSQADMLLWSKYYYVALTSLWVAFIIDSRRGLSTVLYLVCSYLPSVFMLLNMFVTFLPRGSYTLCRSMYIINICVGFLSMFSAECIFILRTLAVWERERRFMVFKIINIIVRPIPGGCSRVNMSDSFPQAYLIPILVCFLEFIPSVGECSIPGGVGYVDTKAKSSVIAVYCLLAAGELEILVFVLYRAFESHSGWKIENRLMRGLMHHNLLYFSCSFAFSLGIILATVFLPFPVVHIIGETQVVALSLLVTRMHRDFWRSDRVYCSNDGVDLSLSTFMAATLDVIPCPDVRIGGHSGIMLRV